MSDEYGVHRSSADNATVWFVGIIVALALLAIGYLVFSANEREGPIEAAQVQCMIANPGFDCVQVQRWERKSP